MEKSQYRLYVNPLQKSRREKGVGCCTSSINTRQPDHTQPLINFQTPILLQIEPGFLEEFSCWADSDGHDDYVCGDGFTVFQFYGADFSGGGGGGFSGVDGGGHVEFDPFGFVHFL